VICMLTYQGLNLPCILREKYMLLSPAELY